MTQALQFAGSLLAILALAWLARRLRLGGDMRLADADEARRLADDALCGFEANDVALDRAGTAALLRDSTGRIMLLRRHGAHWAARILGPGDSARLERSVLTITSRERSFGSTTLDLGDRAQVWAERLEQAK